MSDSSAEYWNLTLGVMDCEVEIEANLENETSGDEWEFSWGIIGPCGNTGDITLEIDLDGDGTDESVEGFEFDQPPSLDPGIYDASFDVANLSSTGSYSMEWFVFSERSDEEHEFISNWSGTDPGTQLDFDFEVQIMTCGIMIQAILFDNGPGEAIGGFVTMMTGPCIDPVTVSVWDEDAGEWIELFSGVESEWYPDCYWDDAETLWWCGMDFDGDGELDSEEDWWYYCEDASGDGWHCTDSFGQSEDHEFTENNSLLSPIMLDEGVYDVMVNISTLNTSTHYAVSLIGLEPGYLEFNSTSENYSISAELEVSPYDCEEYITIIVWDDPSNWPNGIPAIHDDYSMYEGPCEEPDSPFTLTYDGVEWEEEPYYVEYDDCTDVGDGYECEEGHDVDDDGEDDYTTTRYFEYDDCGMESGLWFCYDGHESPAIEEGNHTMELLIEELEVGENYSLSVETEVCSHQGCDYEEMVSNFTASDVNETVTFHMETSNFTCHAHVHADLSEIHSHQGMNWQSHIHGEGFGFIGPCEQPPSPFTLTYDGVEWEEETYNTTYDDCTDVGDGYECEFSFDTDGDGVDDEFHIHHYGYDDCEWVESDMIWLCIGWMEQPTIEEGNHTMELLIEELEVGENYSVYVKTDDCVGWFECDSEEMVSDFTASGVNETVTFHMETSNFTCGAHVHAELSGVDSGNNSHHIFGEDFGFRGPCEEPPSSIQLIYEDEFGDLVEWEGVSQYMEYDDCTDVGDGYECEFSFDTDGDGVDDQNHYHHYWYDDCEWVESDMVWYCFAELWPSIENGTHGMTWNVSELEDGADYELHWDVEFGLSMGYGSWEQHSENFTGDTDGFEHIDWDLTVNSTV
jgi:hypothetical protein